MPLLAQLYESIQDVEYAEPDWVVSICIAWNDIGMFWSGNWNIIFGMIALDMDAVIAGFCW